MAGFPPSPALLYQGLSAGPGWERSYEVQPGVPFDASRADLRQYSPFRFSIVPPPQLMDALGQLQTEEDVSIIGAALDVNDSFSTFDRQREEFRGSPIIANSKALRTKQLQNLVSNNGVQFDAVTGQKTLANVLGISDVTQALSVIAQLRAMLETPPLTLLVNPQSLTINYRKKQQYQDRNRNGYIFQAWGEDQVRLNVQGRIGAFFAGSTFLDSGQPQNFAGRGGRRQGAVTETTSVSGNQFAAKRDSASWQNLMNVLTIYRNNGYIYDEVEGTEAHQWIGMVSITYDQFTYSGHFENFTYGYTEQNMRGGIEFTFDFVASFVTDTAQRNLQVTPIRAPTPSPSDPLWSDPNKQPLPLETNRGQRISRESRSDVPPSPVLNPATAALLLRGG